MGWPLPSSLFPGTWGGRRRPGLGSVGDAQHPCRATSAGPCLSPPLHAPPLPPPGFLGTPLASPCPPEDLPGTLLPVAECSGYHRVQSCIIKLPWLFALETFTIPCSAGKDDCSKPKLGINYTTTLHFSSTKENCVARAAQAPPSQRPPLQGLLWKASQTA